MAWLLTPLLIALIFIVIYILDHRSASREPSQWRMTEAGRDYYLPYSGRQLDEHECSHYEQAMLARACALVEQRRTGRWTGQPVTVTWHPGLDDEADSHANWLIKHSQGYGVTVHRVVE